MDIAGIISLFTEAAFPIAVAAFLLVSTTKKLEQIKVNQLKILIMLAMLLKCNDVVIPDSKLQDLIKVLVED